MQNRAGAVGHLGHEFAVGFIVGGLFAAYRRILRTSLSCTLAAVHLRPCASSWLSCRLSSLRDFLATLRLIGYLLITDLMSSRLASQCRGSDLALG